jgi:hypothetical protein
MIAIFRLYKINELCGNHLFKVQAAGRAFLGCYF